jgi:hypothetical protein
MMTMSLPLLEMTSLPPKSGSSSRLLEEVTEGGWCASKLGLSPEYPGLQYESENKE